jgi:hypothetical protein
MTFFGKMANVMTLPLTNFENLLGIDNYVYHILQWSVTLHVTSIIPL